jgi:hypothetical protein
MDRSVNTSSSIKDVDSELRKMLVQIDVTSTSLDTLVSPGQSNLKKSFDSYSDNVAKLEGEGKTVLKRLDEMKSRSKEYFEEWEKQGDAFTNPQIRELSEERRTNLAATYAKVPEAGAGIKGAYNAYLRDQKEIQMYLSNDLTPKGVAAITPVAQKSVQDKDELKESVKPVLAALDEIKAELYGGKK